MKTRRPNTPQHIKDLMVELYLSGKTAEESTRPFGYPSWACIDELRKRKINRRNRREYVLDEDFFNKIDTEEKAYWLGFITADGSVTKGRLTICLASIDKNHIKKFIKDIKSESFVVDRVDFIKDRKRSTCTSSIHSIKIVNSLNNLGITPNKTFTVKPCLDVPSDLIRHYWRGVIDGDGCIGNYQNKWRIELVGNQYMVKGFSNWVESLVSTKAKPRQVKNSWNVQYSGNKIAIKLANILYYNCSVFLDRKKELADLAIKETDYANP